MYVFSEEEGFISGCVTKSRQLKDSVRKSIVDYLELVTGNDKAASLLANGVIQIVNTDDAQWKLKGLDDTNRESLKKHVIHNYMSQHV